VCGLTLGVKRNDVYKGIFSKIGLTTFRPRYWCFEEPNQDIVLSEEQRLIALGMMFFVRSAPVFWLAPNRWRLVDENIESGSTAW